MRKLDIGKDFYRREYSIFIEDALIVKDMFEIAMRFIDKYLVLPADMSVLLKPLGGFHGYWIETNRTMYIDPRLKSRHRNLGNHLSVFIHEAAHAEQCYSGALQFKEDGVYWYDKKYCTVIDDLPYEEYLNLPWEVDARIKQECLVELLANDIFAESKRK